MAGEVLDTGVSTETPEGILIELRPAGLTPRLYAFLIDQFIRLCILMAIGTVATFMEGVGMGLYLIIAFLLEWFYPVLFELSRWGTTPGKRALKLKVVMDTGLPITPAASFTRNLLRVVDFLPLLYGFAAISMLTRSDFKRLGDIAAATLVVYQPQPSSKITLESIAPLAPAMALSPRDQAAIIALAARASRLTADRMDELAAIAAPVSGDAGRSGPEVTRRVLAVAQWLLGRR
ncbi:putative RDD family membrane protein YckC [Povalibacter uvarum]|uniref:Putative RDD family membrane protein YckC n=1 Tax=Povalibacter uvarum TaxID=732238 RepID=A0A841HR78_9GAMM|nr:RDD family protein [Povalibacter uvarum]MBB6095861.1 putative RDD family membrane protein YckC [Povalibacter uvarum]